MNKGTFGFPTRLSDPTTHFRRAPRLFVPSDYGTCGLWVRASDLIDTFADPRSTQIITTWADQSGSANDFSFNTATAGASAGGIFVPRSWRGFPGVRVQATRATSSYVPATGANVRSIVAVLSHPLYTNTDQILFAYGGTGSLAGFGLALRSSGLTYNAYVPGFTTGSGNAAPATPEVVICAFDGTNVRIWVNGSSYLNSAQALNTASTNGMFLGCSLANNAFAAFTLYEFAAFSSDLTSQVSTITSVLRAEYEC